MLVLPLKIIDFFTGMSPRDQRVDRSAGKYPRNRDRERERERERDAYYNKYPDKYNRGNVYRLVSFKYSGDQFTVVPNLEST